MTPDGAAKPTNVPYASFGNPQSLNLYSYVNNNPTTTRDPDGHCPPCGEDLIEDLALGNVGTDGTYADYSLAIRESPKKPGMRTGKNW
jgi:hypothetical protein